MHVVGVEILSETIVGREGGFLAIRRLTMANVLEDGSRSRPYLVDYVVRPKGSDAVVVGIFARGPRGIEVLIRAGLRPPISIGRGGPGIPIPDARPYLFFPECVAGILEDEDVGEEGIRRRAAIEVLEEAGYEVRPEDVVHLGAGCFPSPGSMIEKFWLTAVEVIDRTAVRSPPGDGSPMEDDARIEWMGLNDAIEACVEGRIEDAKTEIVLRRLAARLAPSASGGPAV